MVCWIIPLIATMVGFIGRKVSHKKNLHGFWLNIMLLGGALFGAIDHLWYGELFLINANWLTDLALGGIITGGITTSWGIIVFKPKITDSLKHLSYQLGILRK
ncbi:hypothetical protein ACFLQN_01100 [Candidatus Aenigmatarchaeota archaeon]